MINMRNITTGTFIRLESAYKCYSGLFIVEVVQKDLIKHAFKVLLACVENPYLRLHLNTSGLEYKEVTSPNRDCLFNIEEVVGESLLINYRLFTYSDGKQTNRNYLAWTDLGGLTVLSIEKQDVEFNRVQKPFTDFAISVVDRTASLPLSSALNSNPVAPNPITKKQLRDLAVHGYLVLPQIINPTKTTQCSQYLLHHVGQVGYLIPGAVQGGEYGKFPGSTSQSKAIKDLFTNNLKHVVEYIMGGNVDQVNNLNTQIAFRFPELPAVESGEAGVIEWHVDGYRQGIAHSFSLLVGVCLSDQDRKNCGNLCVWPGSHFLLHRCKVGPHGDIDVDRVKQEVETNPVYADFKSGYSVQPPPPSKTMSRTAEVLGRRPDLPRLGCPEQVALKAGDVVILHPDLAHGGAPNLSSSIRQMVYFRVRLQSESWSQLSDMHMHDMWVDLQGVRNILGAELEQLQAIYYAP